MRNNTRLKAKEKGVIKGVEKNCLSLTWFKIRPDLTNFSASGTGVQQTFKFITTEYFAFVEF